MRKRLPIFDPHEEVLIEAKDIWILGEMATFGIGSGRVVVTTERLFWFSNASMSREVFIARHEIASCRIIEPPRFDVSRLFGHSKRRLEIILKDRTIYAFEGAQTRQIFAELQK